MSKKPDDAAKIAGLAGILQAGNKQKEIPTSPPALPPAAAVDVPSPAPSGRSKKERVGKYRDPNFHHYGVYLRKDTHKRVKRRLEDTESDKDLSELVQELLEQWLKS